MISTVDNPVQIFTVQPKLPGLSKWLKGFVWEHLESKMEKNRPLEAFKKKILLYVVMAKKPFQLAKSGFRGDFAHGSEGDL